MSAADAQTRAVLLVARLLVALVRRRAVPQAQRRLPADAVWST